MRALRLTRTPHVPFALLSQVYETNQLPSIENSFVWGGDTFAAVAEALKAPIMRTQVSTIKLSARPFLSHIFTHH